MNYEKKRKRQNGRQECRPSERYRAKLEAHFEKVGADITRMIEEGVLPPITFSSDPIYKYHMKPMTQQEFVQVYPPIDKL